MNQEYSEHEYDDECVCVSGYVGICQVAQDNTRCKCVLWFHIQWLCVGAECRAAFLLCETVRSFNYYAHVNSAVSLWVGILSTNESEAGHPLVCTVFLAVRWVGCGLSVHVAENSVYDVMFLLCVVLGLTSSVGDDRLIDLPARNSRI